MNNEMKSLTKRKKFKEAKDVKKSRNFNDALDTVTLQKSNAVSPPPPKMIEKRKEKKYFKFLVERPFLVHFYKYLWIVPIFHYIS